MSKRSDKGLESVVVRAREEARMLGASRLEAEHLLLALTRQRERDAGRLLADVGLDHERLREALDNELAQSLEAVGVASGAIALAEMPVPTTGQPRWGASAKRALQRAALIARARGDRGLRPTHVLLGVLEAGEGTVPRTLSAAGVDVLALVARVEATLDPPR
jgi:ATP-dependent Clp protease ATP-binding subunit ClpA